MNNKSVAEIISLLFIFLFVYAAVNKLLDMEKFIVQVGQSPLLTAFRWIAWVVPALEILIALILTTTRFRLMGLYASFSLMVMFSAYIIAILNFSYYIPCSCGGILEMLGWKEHLIFNLVFVILAFLAIVLESKALAATGSTAKKLRGGA